MTPSEKLKILQRLSGMTQQQLADKIGVTFAALNRWMNNQAQPRPSALEKINELYREYSGEKTVPESVLLAKKQVLFSKHHAQKNALKIILSRPDLRDQFDLSLTYHSNRIEGSKLTENETEAILFHNKVIPDRTLVEQLEAKNHQTALHFLFDFVSDQKVFDEDFILKFHTILMNGIHPEAGNYRHHGVRIVGARVVTANHLKVPFLMKELIHEIQKKSDDMISRIALVHARFEQIHPFGDGNGRVGRLLMHGMLLQQGFPPAVILQEDRQKYFTYLSRAQLQEDYSLLEDFLCDAVLEGYRLMEA